MFKLTVATIVGVQNKMMEIIQKHYLLNRTAINPDTDILINYIKKNELPGCRILEFRSGMKCLTWTIPKAWKVRKAYLSRINGEKIIDFKNNPLHLWTHSIPFEGEISLEELKKHLCYDPKYPEWVPYRFRNGFRYGAKDWGFSMSYNDYMKMLKLNEDRFHVLIDADLNNSGTMKVIDYHLRRKKPNTIFFAAHTCHPGIVTDGLSCVAVLVALFKELRKKSLKYSYRLILGPEYFAAAGFLSKLSVKEIKTLNAGIFLDMIGNNEPLGFQTSYQGNSPIDVAVRNVFQHHVENHVVKPYRKLWGNDEMFYNGPGFNIPTVGIGGDKHKAYHFDADNLDNLNYKQLDECLDVLKKIVDIFETNYIPVRKYKGPLYLSKYGLYIDPKINQKGYDAIEYIQIEMDGKNSCLDIAHKLGIDYFFVYDFCEKLYQKRLIKKRPAHIFRKD